MAVGVEYFDAAGNKKHVLAQKIILAASAVGTPRILLNSKSKDSPNGLANENDQVGRNLMIHPLGIVDGVFDYDLDTDIGPQGCMIYSLQHYRNPLADHKLGYMMHALRGGGPLEAARVAWLRKRLRFGKDLLSDFDIFFKRQMAISIICEDLPEAKNRIYLDHNIADPYGISGVKVEYKLHKNTKAAMLAGMANARKIMMTAGSRKHLLMGLCVILAGTRWVHVVWGETPRLQWLINLAKLMGSICISRTPVSLLRVLASTQPTQFKLSPYIWQIILLNNLRRLDNGCLTIVGCYVSR